MAYAVGVISALCTFLLTKLFSSVTSVNTMILHAVLQKQDAYTHPQLPQITSAPASLKADIFYVLQMSSALLERKFFKGLSMDVIYLDFNCKA